MMEFQEVRVQAGVKAGGRQRIVSCGSLTENASKVVEIEQKTESHAQGSWQEVTAPAMVRKGV